MILHLADRLDVPLRERNALLLAGGYAPVFGESSLDDVDMNPVREALERFLSAHEPYPAIVVDRHWNLVLANRTVGVLLRGVAPDLLEPPANALRVALHPAGMAPRIGNLGDWSAHLLKRLRRQIAVTGDERLEALYDELASYPGVRARGTPLDDDLQTELLLALKIRWDESALAFISSVTTFGTALDITLAELAIEAFYPADRETAAALAQAVHAAS